VIPTWNRNAGVVEEVTRAIARDEFVLDFQPIASIAGGHVEAMEALVRCDVTARDGSRRRVRYELRRSLVPAHHVWILAGDDRHA
jgi:hypothetical protein